MNRRWLRWIGYVLVAIVFAIVCVLLSQWQFARNSERSGNNAVIEQNYDAPPQALVALLEEKGELSHEEEWQPVTVTGRYEPEGQLLARNRPHGGTSAFEVLTPLRLADGRVVIVDRGWVPPGEGPLPDAIPAPPDGEVTVTGRIRLGEPLPPSGRGAPDGQVPTVHLPSVAKVTGDETLTTFYLLRASEEPVPETAPHLLEPPTTDPGPHLSYAVQWILFALMGFVFIFYMIRTELRHRDDEPSPRRRRDRDAEEEDALLDAS